MHFILQLYFVFVLSCSWKLEGQKSVEILHRELHVIKYSIVYTSDYSLYFYLLDYIYLLFLT